MSFSRFLGNSGGSTSGFSRFLSDDDKKDAQVQRQIDNATTRIQDAGYKKEDTDKRNWFEKFTNLPKGQNWFFDTLEILGRPGQAVMNTIDKAPQGNGAGFKAAWDGFTGNERIRGTDLAEKAGIDNPIAKFVVGTGLEIGLDPTTYIPGGVLAKGVQKGAATAIKPVKSAYSALENAAPAVRTFRETRIAPAMESAKDSLGYMFKADYKQGETLSGETSDFLKNLSQQTENSRMYMQETSLENIGRTARKAGGLDAGVDVGRIVEAPLRQFEDVKAYEFPDGLRRTEDKKEVVSEIQANVQKLKDLGKETKHVSRQYQGAIGDFVKGLNQTDEEIRKLYMSLERQTGSELDASTRQNLREARKELQRLDSQINNFDSVRASYIKHFEKEIQEAHVASFDLIKRVRETAPNGIKGVSYKEMPKGMLIRNVGKGIDEVADELGYKYADELIQDLKALKDIPQKLDKDTLRRFAQQEYTRMGADKHLEETLNGLIQAKSNVVASIKDVAKKAKVPNASKVAKKAFGALSQSPRYMELDSQRKALRSQLDGLKGESKQARQSKLDEIKQVESEIEALRESARNPVMMQKELERPARELSTDPKIQQAASEIMKSNNVLRQFAEERGIPVPELEGYMTHVWSAEQRAREKITRPKSVDRGSFNAANPSKSLLNNRKLTGSAEDINERMAKSGKIKEGETYFEPNAFFASAIGQKRLIDFVHAADFRRQILSNQDFAIPFKKGMTIPQNGVVIDVNNYKFIKESGDLLEGMGLADEIGGQYIVTKAAKQLLDRYQHINTDEGTKAFLKAFDSVQSFWKRGALFSVGYHVRNMAGAMFNNYVGGMNPIDLAKFTKEGFEEITKAANGKGSKLFEEYRKQGLSSTSLSQIEFAKYGEEPEKAVERTVRKMSRTTTKEKVVDRVKSPFETSQEVGNYFDQGNRFALFKWAVEKKGMSFEEAAAKVREVQFDYSKLTPFEQKFVSRAVPFYRWMRNNIPFQVRKFINDPRKYGYMNKVRLNAQDSVGINDENVPDYMKEAFHIPVYGKDGKGQMLGLNLPLGDLTKLSNPGKMLVDSLTPLAKTPTELALNYNMFYRKPIEKFEGQEKQYEIPMTGLEFGVPIRGAYAVEQATGQIGRGLSGFLQKPANADQDNKFRMPTMGISSLTKPFDVERYEDLKKLEELRILQEFMNYIEQQTGQKPRTMQEITMGSR